MMNTLQAIGFGIVGFAVIVVIGIVVIVRLSDSIAICPTGETYNATDRYCWNDTAQRSEPGNTGWVTGDYISGQLGSSGLSGWIPAVIAVAIGGLFLALFGGKKRY